jgi:hypothetical protein
MQHSNQKKPVEVWLPAMIISCGQRESLGGSAQFLPGSKAWTWLVLLQWFACGSVVMGKAKKGRAHSKANRQDPLGSSNKGKDKPEADTPQAHYLLNEVSHGYTLEPDRRHRFQSPGAGW